MACRRFKAKVSVTSVALTIVVNTVLFSQPLFKVLDITSKAKDHSKMIAAARPFLERIAANNKFSVTITSDSGQFDEDRLKQYKVFVQLHEAPFDVSPSLRSALEKFVAQGNGWVGIHAAGLTGKLYTGAANPQWTWFDEFMGSVSYSPHPKFQKGILIIEDRNHPVTKNLPERFEISDEWYEFDKSPRPDVRVLAVADESSYTQNKPMGDHPLIWVNEHFRRMVYIGIGHDASLCSDKNYEILVRDAILWASER